MPDKSITASILWDRFGIGVSGICAIHCLIVPVLISILPVWSVLPVLHDWAHPVFVLMVAPIVYFASRRSHFDFKITAFLLTGFVFILAGWLLGHYWLGLLFETTFTVLGSVVLIIGHWFNYRHHRSCNIKSHQHHAVIEEKPE